MTTIKQLSAKPMDANEYMRRINRGAKRIAAMTEEPEVGLGTYMLALGAEIERFSRFAQVWPFADNEEYK